MIRNVTQPVKIINDFFEAPMLIRHLALKQNYTDQDNPVYFGTKSQTLDNINMDFFDTLLVKLIVHVNYKNRFEFLHCDFNFVDQDTTPEIVEHNSRYNIAGTVFLNPEPEESSGMHFFSNIAGRVLPSIKIENMYNRCVLYDPQKPHKFEKYCGTTKEDKSLFLNFYGIAVHDE